MPQGPLRSMFETLRHMEHYVRTSFGVSERSFNAQQVNEIAIQGIGQGNGAGPQIWAAVSTVLLQALRATGIGGAFQSAISNKAFEFVGYAFVDDTDLVVTGGDNKSCEDTVQNMQRALDTWEGCLRASGGAIEPAKTFWYGIGFEWHKGNWKYIPEVDETLRVRNPAGELTILEQVNVTEARRTLGVRLAPDGNDTEQAKFMLGVIRQWTEGLRTNNLPKSYAWQSYRTTLWPKIRYSLPSTCIKEATCDVMDKEIRRALLPAMGINRNLPKLLAHGSSRLGGLGIPRIAEEQGIAAICQILRYINAPETMTGKLLIASLEALQIEVGTEIPVLEADFAKFGHLATTSVLKNTWEFISKANITIKINLPTVKALRQRDKFLIPTFQENFTRNQLSRLNKCRLAVQAISWADVVTMDGERILARAWKGLVVKTRENIRWPYQGEPTKQDWNLWRKALAITVASTKETSWARLVRQTTGPTLRRRLGDWASDFHTGWEVCWGSGRLFHVPSKAQYLMRPQRRTRRSSAIFDNPCPYNNLPYTSSPARVKEEEGYWSVLSWGSRQRESQTLQAESIREHFQQTTNKNQWLWDNAEWQDEGEVLENAIRSRKAIVVSDGTLKEGRGAASAVIEGRDKNGRIRLDTWTSGDNEQQSSFWSELTGILMAVSFIEDGSQLHRGILPMERYQRGQSGSRVRWRGSLTSSSKTPTSDESQCETQ
jgi:hypothetical protein